jgi:hypothetical protein
MKFEKVAIRLTDNYGIPYLELRGVKFSIAGVTFLYDERTKMIYIYDPESEKKGRITIEDLVPLGKIQLEPYFLHKFKQSKVYIRHYLQAVG